MRFLDFFAGIGGFRLGLERAGHECVGACEIAAFPRRAYKHRFGHAPRWEDVNGIDPKELPEADLWCGGFPCQDVSSAGLRAGLEGERSGLVFVLLRLAAVARPRWLLLENVGDLLVRGRGFDTLLGALDELGYGWSWRVLDAQHFALAQHRERVFLLARDLGATGGCPAGVLAESSCVRGDPSQGGASRTPHTRAAQGDPGRGGWKHAAFTVAPERGQGADLVVSELSERGVRVVAFDPAQITHPENRSRCDEGAPAPSLAASGRPHVAFWIPSNGSQSDPRQSDQARCLDSNGGWGFAAGGTLVSHDPALSLLANGRGRTSDEGANYVIGPGARVRRLTPRECERLMGFPDDWTAIPGAKPTQRYAALGNSVGTTVIEWIGHRLREFA